MNCAAFLRDWASVADARGFQTEVFGEVEGLPLLGSVRKNPGKAVVYLSSGMHGDEPAGPRALLELFREGFFDNRYHWIVCPVLNPTGLAAGTRENSRGIDQNRDYKQCETPEVCSHLAWLKKQPVPSLFLSLHEDWESSGFYYYEINLGVKGPERNRLMEAVSPFFPPEPATVIDDHEVTEPGWIFHSENPDVPEGWPEAIYLAKLGCPLSLTFETPSSLALEGRIGGHQAVVRQALSDFSP
jgi:hypothetical protein